MLSKRCILHPPGWTLIILASKPNKKGGLIAGWHHSICTIAQCASCWPIKLQTDQRAILSLNKPKFPCCVHATFMPPCQPPCTTVSIATINFNFEILEFSMSVEKPSYDELRDPESTAADSCRRRAWLASTWITDWLCRAIDIHKHHFDPNTSPNRVWPLPVQINCSKCPQRTAPTPTCLQTQS
jgi:hypothetical protein